MHNSFLLVAMILMWIMVVVGIQLRISIVHALSVRPAIRQSPPGNMMEKVWFVAYLAVIGYLVYLLTLQWESHEVKSHVTGALICFGVAGAVFALYFVNRKKIPAMREKDPAAGQSLKLWVSIANVLLIFAAVFLSIAYRHS